MARGAMSRRKPDPLAAEPSDSPTPSSDPATGGGQTGDGDAPPVEVLGALIEGPATIGEEEHQAEGGAGDQGEGDGVSPGHVDPDAFRHMIAFGLTTAGTVGGLQTLARSPQIPGFDAAAEEFRKVCERTPALQWLVAPDNPNVQAAFVIGQWAVPVVQGCRIEIAHKRAQKARDGQGAATGGDGADTAAVPLDDDDGEEEAA